MKKVLGFAIALAAILFIGCGDETVLDPPSVTYTVENTGATLRFTWIEITDAEGYYIYADGAVVDSIDDPAITTYDATTPAKMYEVSAYAGEDESDLTQIDCAPVVTTSLDVWDMSEPPPNPSGFGFNASGTAVGVALTDTASWANIDYYIEDAPQRFFSPHHGNYNTEVNVTVNTGGTDFDAVDIADAPGGYNSQTDISVDAVYYFWIDPTDNGWDSSTDNFGKIKIEAISGTQITMKLAFQPIAGLRWCVTP